MEFNEYQKLAKTTLVNNNEDDRLLMARLTLGLVGEAGEVAEKIKKHIRGDKNYIELKESIAKELGDVLWYLSVLSDECFNINLDYIATENLKKLQERKNNNKIRGSGDER